MRRAEQEGALMFRIDDVFRAESLGKKYDDIGDAEQVEVQYIIKERHIAVNDKNGR